MGILLHKQATHTKHLWPECKFLHSTIFIYFQFSGISTDTDVPKTICSPQLSQDNHPDNVDASISPFGFKYK